MCLSHPLQSHFHLQQCFNQQPLIGFIWKCGKPSVSAMIWWCLLLKLNTSTTVYHGRGGEDKTALPWLSRSVCWDLKYQGCYFCNPRVFPFRQTCLDVVKASATLSPPVGIKQQWRQTRKKVEEHEKNSFIISLQNQPLKWLKSLLCALHQRACEKEFCHLYFNIKWKY